MRSLICALLVASLVWAPLVAARPTTLPADEVQKQATVDAAREVQDINSPYEIDLAVEELDPELRAGLLDGQGTNLLASFVIMGVHLYRQQMAISHFQGESMDYAAVLKAVAVLAPTVATSGAWWCSVAGGTCVAAGGKKIAQLLRHSLYGDAAGVALKSVLTRFLTASISRTVFFGGFAAGASLWNHAVDKLPDDEQEMGNSLFTAFVHTFTTGSVTTLGKEGVVFGHIVLNMGEIAIVSSAERNMWLYDLWRNDIARGQFVTGTAGFLAGAELGTLAGGTRGSAYGAAVGGLIGGAIGAGAAVGLTPQKWNEAVDQTLIQARLDHVMARVNQCMKNFVETRHYLENEPEDTISKDESDWYESDVSLCEAMRNDAMTILIDNVWHAYEQYRLFTNRLEASQKSGKFDIIRESTEGQAKALSHLRTAIATAIAFYPTEEKTLKGYVGTSRYEALNEIGGFEVARLQKVGSVIKTKLTGFLNDLFNVTSQNLIAYTAKGGFYEEQWLGAYQEKN